jgi:hypothetical protein
MHRISSKYTNGGWPAAPCWAPPLLSTPLCRLNSPHSVAVTAVRNQPGTSHQAAAIPCTRLHYRSMPLLHPGQMSQQIPPHSSRLLPRDLELCWFNLKSSTHDPGQRILTVTVCIRPTRAAVAHSQPALMSDILALSWAPYNICRLTSCTLPSPRGLQRPPCTEGASCAMLVSHSGSIYMDPLVKVAVNSGVGKSLLAPHRLFQQRSSAQNYVTCLAEYIHYITLQDFNVHGANTTHGTESEVLYKLVVNFHL